MTGEKIGSESALLPDIDIIEPSNYAADPKENATFEAGSGYCYACKREGRNPLDGGKPCGGFINDNKGLGNCKVCGHNFNQHA